MRRFKRGLGFLVIPFLASCGSGGTESSTDDDTVVEAAVAGVQSGKVQTSVGSGSAVTWDSANCVVVEGKTEWRIEGFIGGTTDSDNRFYINGPDEVASKQVMIRIVKTKNCTIVAETRIEYSTKNWLCPGDMITVDGKSCAIDRATD